MSSASLPRGWRRSEENHLKSSDRLSQGLRRFWSSTISEESFWDTDPVITIYMPNRELRYQVFAAVPYSDEHILYYHDFSDPDVYESFFDDVFSTYSDAARFHEEYAPEYGDKVLMLATCLMGNHSRRFIVMGKLVYDSAALN